jgi:hypothetical protein
MTPPNRSRLPGAPFFAAEAVRSQGAGGGRVRYPHATVRLRFFRVNAWHGKAAIAAQWERHNPILGVKNQVIARFGGDSDEVASLA